MQESQLLLIRLIVSFKFLRQYLNVTDTSVFYFKREIRNWIPACCAHVLTSKAACGLTAFQAEASVCPHHPPNTHAHSLFCLAELSVKCTGLAGNEKHNF